MSATRATTARHVRQRKLNTKQPLRIIRESDIEDAPDDEAQRHIPQVETGVEKGEEIEYHLQAVIHAATAAALGSKAAVAQSYIPTPDTVKAQDVKYDELYPSVFKEPQTYIRFSSTVEDSVGVAYCMDDEDADFLSKLNDGKDVHGQPRKDKLSQCSADVFEEGMEFFEETSARLQPFATVVENAPILSFEEMERAVEEGERSFDRPGISNEAQKWLKYLYQYWVEKKGSLRPLMPSVKVRVLDTASDADDADPYICFRRREVRQTRKTRGRDAQVVEKLKKLRLELEQARALVQLVAQREQANKENLEISREVFAQRKMLKQVKAQHHIIGEKGDDEELLVNQKPVAPKPKSSGRQQDGSQRPATIRIRSDSQRSPDNDLIQLADIQAEASAQVRHTIEARKDQHRRWNQQWVDATWRPITPPLDSPQDPPRWAPLFAGGESYPTPPPTLPSEGSRDEDTDMQDSNTNTNNDNDNPDNQLKQNSHKRVMARDTPEPEFIFHIPGAYPVDENDELILLPPKTNRNAAPACRLRYGRGGRCHLETKRRKLNSFMFSGVVSETDSDDDDDGPGGGGGGDGEDFFAVDPQKVFDYRSAIQYRSRPDAASAGNAGGGGGRHSSSVGSAGAEQAALMAQAAAAAQQGQQHGGGNAQQQASAGASAG